MSMDASLADDSGTAGIDDAGKGPKLASGGSSLHPAFLQMCQILDATVTFLHILSLDLQSRKCRWEHRALLPSGGALCWNGCPSKRQSLQNERRERLIKASRDVTIHSKKVIFAVHRATGTNKAAMLEQAEKELGVVRTKQVGRLARELQGDDYWKFRRAYSPGIQEYVEAATVVEYCKTGQLLTLEQLNQSLSDLMDAANSPFRVSMPDYILGVGDLTGELMRLAVSGIAAGNQQAAISVCNTVRSLYEGFNVLPPLQENLRDWKLKLDTMLQSLIKIETACYTVHVRGSEYPQDMLLEAFELPRNNQRDDF